METKERPFIYLGIDIGGTLSKVCIWVSKGLQVQIENLTDLKASFNKGELIFNKFKNDELPQLLEKLHNLNKEFEIKHLHVTGGGAYKYAEELKKLDPDYVKEQEINSLLKGLNFLMSEVDQCSFHYRDASGPMYLNRRPDYPFILVNIGSGVSMVKFTDKNTYQRIGGTTLGGGLFLGLSNLLCGTNNFDELLEMAKKGKSSNADLLIRDIYPGMESPHSTLSSESLAISLGKMAIEQIRNVKNIKKEDMIQSFLIMVAFNISQQAYYLAKNENIKHVFFAGNFIRNHTDTMNCISYGLNYFSAHDGEAINAIFLKHDGFLGALGCTLEAAKKDEYEIN